MSQHVPCTTKKMIIYKWNILHLSAPNLNIHIHSKPFSFVVPGVVRPNVVSSANPPAMQDGEPGSPATSA